MEIDDILLYPGSQAQATRGVESRHSRFGLFDTCSRKKCSADYDGP